MTNAAKYSAGEVLRDGRRIVIRALRTDDRADLLGAVERTSAQSLYLGTTKLSHPRDLGNDGCFR